MTLSEVAQKVLTLDRGIPVKIFYEGLQGDFYPDADGALKYYKATGAPTSGYVLTLDELARSDWQMVKR